MVCNVDLPVPSAPTLILDMLVGGATAMTADAICRAGVLMGVAEATMRVSLTRLKSAGKVHCIERGLYKIAPAAHPLHEMVRQWHRKRALCKPWIRGDWVAIHDTAVPKSDRSAHRHHLLALSLLGFVELRDGLHIRPDNFVGGVNGQLSRLRSLGLADQALGFKLCSLEERLEAQALTLWDVEALIRSDQAYLAALETSRAAFGRSPLGVAARESLLLGRTVIAHLVRDPVLPSELMSGAVRERLLAETMAYQKQARSLWREWLERPADEPAATPASRLPAKQRNPAPFVG